MLIFYISTDKEVIGNLTVTIFNDINKLNINKFPIGTYLKNIMRQMSYFKMLNLNKSILLLI